MKFIYRVHAIQRMFERTISTKDVCVVLDTGETIEEYPDDTPYPSRLIVGWQGERPLHVVVAMNAADDEVIIVTVYEPDITRWEADFKRRKA